MVDKMIYNIFLKYHKDNNKLTSDDYKLTLVRVIYQFEMVIEKKSRFCYRTAYPITI